MGGLFGVVSKEECINDLFYGVDYHSHLGTTIGGLAVLSNRLSDPVCHDLTNSQFKTEFKDDFTKLSGNLGIGVISSTEQDKQPLVFKSKLGTFALCTDSSIKNADTLITEMLNDGVSFKAFTNSVNQTELVGELICQGTSITQGIVNMYQKIRGTVSLLLLSENERCIYASSGVFPLVLGKKVTPRGDQWAIASETTAFPNLHYEIYSYPRYKDLVSIDEAGVKIRRKNREKVVFCPFLHVYFDFPTSNYYGVNSEIVRERCGGFLAEGDEVQPDLVMGVADSGIPHAHGYTKHKVNRAIEKAKEALNSFERGAISPETLALVLRKNLQQIVPLRRPVIKFTTAWSRSYIPPQQATRDLIAYYKQVPNAQMILNQTILLVDDSIRRGTQLRRFIQDKIQPYKPKAIHARIASPPQLFSCYLDKTTNHSDLIARKAVTQIEQDATQDLNAYLNMESPQYKKMIQLINEAIGTTSLKFISLSDMIKAIIDAPGNTLKEENLCTYCWTGKPPKI